MSPQTASETHSHKDSESIILHFGTKPHEIDAKTLLESFGAIEAALMGISRHSHPDARFHIKVKPFQKGSFEVPIEVQQFLFATGLSLMSPDWANAKETVKILLELIKLKLELKCKEPKAVRKNGHVVEIEKNSRCTINVDQRTYNIHVKDSVVGESLARGFKALEADTEVKSFTVLSKQREKMLDVPRRSFRYVSKVKKENTDGQAAIERLKLPIFKAVLDKSKGHKWEFYYRGIKRIPATIADESFLARVDGGERFGRGDTLDVELEIIKQFDEKLGVFVNKSYKIARVHGIHRREEQSEFLKG
jgi:hypothetical protein